MHTPRGLRCLQDFYGGSLCPENSQSQDLFLLEVCTCARSCSVVQPGSPQSSCPRPGESAAAAVPRACQGSLTGCLQRPGLRELRSQGGGRGWVGPGLACFVLCLLVTLCSLNAPWFSSCLISVRDLCEEHVGLSITPRCAFRAQQKTCPASPGCPVKGSAVCPDEVWGSPAGGVQIFCPAVGGCG